MKRRGVPLMNFVSGNTSTWQRETERELSFFSFSF